MYGGPPQSQRSGVVEPDESPPVWPVFGDLMAGLFGLFVLFFMWAITFQTDLANTLEAREAALVAQQKALAQKQADLDAERAARKKEKARLEALERALAGPLSEGLITLTEGRIGIRGSVLFSSNSAALTAEGTTLIGQLAGPLEAFLKGREEMVMISGYTDDKPIARGNARFADNWALSSERALTVTRALTESGLPGDRLIAAGFGPNHPVATNETPEGRALNRRVEIQPVPRATAGGR
ncbi:MAG: OmpA family protein [Bradymonadia bacterium]